MNQFCIECVCRYKYLMHVDNAENRIGTRGRNADVAFALNPVGMLIDSSVNNGYIHSTIINNYVTHNYLC